MKRAHPAAHAQVCGTVEQHTARGHAKVVVTYHADAAALQIEHYLDTRNADTSKQEGGHPPQHTHRDGGEERSHLRTYTATDQTWVRSR